MARRITLLTVSWIVLSIPLGFYPPQSQDKRGIAVVPAVTGKGRRINLYQGGHALLVGVSQYTAGRPKLESVPGKTDRLRQALEAQWTS